MYMDIGMDIDIDGEGEKNEGGRERKKPTNGCIPTLSHEPLNLLITEPEDKEEEAFEARLKSLRVS